MELFKTVPARILIGIHLFLQLLRFMYNSKKTINSFDAQNLWLNCIFILKTNTSKIKNLTVKIMLIQNPFLKI